MKRFLSVGLLLLSTGFTSEAQSSSNLHNGYWWLDASELVRLAYVVGFVDGAEQGRFWLGIISQAKGNTVTKASADYVNGQLDYNRIRFGQFKDGLDEFYKNYKNKSILVDDAFGYVRDSIRGVDQTQLVQELETLRKQSVSSSHDSNK